MVSSSLSNFAQLIKKFRQQCGMSRNALARATEISRIYISQLEDGKRSNPSPYVAEGIARALGLQGEERRLFSAAFTSLTGQQIDDEQPVRELLDFGELALLLLHSTSYPAHSLDRLWYLHSWNEAAITLLFEPQEIELFLGDMKLHLLELFFVARWRRRFLAWENLARRLVSDFQYSTRTITHLPEYKALWKRLKKLPDFNRIASAIYSEGRPDPTYVLKIQHSELGWLTVRVTTTFFARIIDYSIVSYLPADQRTLELYRKQGWQPS